MTGDVQRWAPQSPARPEPKTPERVWVDAEVIPDHRPTDLLPVLDAEIVVPRPLPAVRYIDPPTVVFPRPAQRPTRRNDLRGLPMALIILAILVLVSVVISR